VSAPVPDRPSAVDATTRSLAAIAADGRTGIWISRVDPHLALARAAAVDRRVARGEHLPLAGTTLAVKDNIDVAGLATTAGCPAFAYEPSADAPAVRALLDAGAVVIGKTNMDQFATGLVGTRSPHGACPNAHWPELIAGGSSSGSAVAVAAGLVDLALGTDTAGSGRVPAAANGIFGVKPTRGRISAAGVVPACRSLDCVSVFARTLDDAVLAADLAAATPMGADDPWRRSPPAAGPGRTSPWTATAGPPLRVGVPLAAGLTFDEDPTGGARFEAALGALVAAGADPVPVDLAPFLEVGRLLYQGSFVAERYEALGGFIEAHADQVDPVVRDIILASSRLRAFELFGDQTDLARLRRLTAPVWDRVDVLVTPTVPRLPTLAEVQAQPVEVNWMLGTYTNFVNLLDLAAVTLPVPAEDDDLSRPPTSVTLLAPAWSDALLAEVARTFGDRRVAAVR
jgi:allophanate hydrolase